MTILDIFTVTSTIAGICMAICQVPQAWHVYKTQSTEGISILMQFIITSGILFWTISGMLLCMENFRSGLPMLLSNGFCLIFCCYILRKCISQNKK